ncbi:MAG: PH domain-containing protein [Hoeflea sp.]|uniref:photosynthetic complex putative assembly protein PuhB n=1 Tax=Hoeflea sp. TaxID=1940281 RepID=UPI001D1F6D65|nr:photosynthetic complex putative assembly protein PuhB [Hoeflea sp.]MBU4527855.1 PH domain-containing protein [Alphaproteobacteria bacterium]MBU4546110.1 PH domain-containing protein [Alphaproteobacteria bacterium]MBU4553205.1 PH domain-containing protein [Alphaproteobacteria bacterium]MBV1724277.1 PH domain-containing protein [Hoeflea sp.]MBV1759962.1 PH domain-containing protein [Hoeflea sp.]
MSETGGPEHDYEPVPGLPARLPEGEYILWQGAPSSAAVSRHVLKTRWIAGYFAVLVAWNISAGLYDGRQPSEILFSSGALAILSTIGIGLMEAFAWGVQKTTLYTITNKRIVMRIGVALSATFNLPFTRIVSADMREGKNGVGDIALTLLPGDRLSWLVFWPHVRGFRKGALMPQMICLKDVAIAGNVLAAALASTRTPENAARLATPATKQTGRATAGRIIEAAE